MSETFRHPYRVGFGDCDVAGIVFYPRYFEMVNRVVETWFADALGCSFRALHLERGYGVPTARFEVDFPAASRLEDTLEFRLRIERLGKSSANLVTEAWSGEQLRLRARQAIVCVDNAKMKSTSWPDDLRARMTPFVIEA